MLNPNDRLLLSSKEAARMLNISERTLWSITNAGLIPFVRIGNAKRYSRADLMDFIESHTQRNPDGPSKPKAK